MANTPDMTLAAVTNVPRQASDVQYHANNGEKTRKMSGTANVPAIVAARICWQRGP